ncbi:hypothetical protein, partial [Nostoc sp. KVJ20]|uniref:hypothetical protein n=1 Tax=Nostoc sp. KVJ20 TaxID=457944 RepID=UPI001C4042DB
MTIDQPKHLYIGSILNKYEFLSRIIRAKLFKSGRKWKPCDPNIAGGRRQFLLEAGGQSITIPSL